MEKYIVVYKGRLLPDANLETVKKRLKESFKLKKSTIDKYFSGKLCILKRDVEFKTAQKIKFLFEKAGAVCEVMTYDGTIPEPPPDIEFEDTSRIPLKMANDLITCPKCGLEQENTYECERCGIVFQKLQAEKKPRVFNWGA